MAFWMTWNLITRYPEMPNVHIFFFLLYRLFSLVLFKQVPRHEMFFPWSFCKSKFASIPCFLSGDLTNENRKAKGSPSASKVFYWLSEVTQDSGNVSLFSVLWHLNLNINLGENYCLRKGKKDLQKGEQTIRRVKFLSFGKPLTTDVNRICECTSENGIWP